MTSTATGLPDRYRPLDQVGPDEPTATGVIRCWRAKDRVLNRDVAIRVHTPGGPAAHAWIARALTAGGLATPALAMVYDAAEGSPDPQAPGGAAYVVNEWIDGETLAERVAAGPMSEREARTIVRRLAEGVADAHRVGLAVGGLAPGNVVLRANGLVGLRAVPAATGTIPGDIADLGALLEFCLTGGAVPEPTSRRAPAVPPDLAALIRRARSAEPGQGLSSVAAMVALLAERPRTGPPMPAVRVDEADSGWLRRLRERRADTGDAPAIDGDAPVRLDQQTRPPVPPPRPAVASDPSPAEATAAYPADDHDDPDDPDQDYDDGLADTVLAAHGYDQPRARRGRGSSDSDDDSDDGSGGPADHGDRTGREQPHGRRRLAVIALPLLALAVVIAIAWYIGNSVLSVAGSVDGTEGSTPTPTAAGGSAPDATAPAGTPATITGATVFDPFGDGEPENDPDVPRSYDGDPASAWSTLEYQGSAAFGNLKPGVGIVYDLGSEQSLSAATITTTLPGSTVEVRTGDRADGDLESFSVAASAQLTATTDLRFDQPVTTRFVLVWLTELAPSGGAFAGDLAEVVLQPGG